MGTFKDRWETFCYRAYYCYIDVWYFVKHFPDTIARIVYYIPRIAKMHDWDGNNLIYFCVAEIERLEHYYECKDTVLADECKDQILAELRETKQAGQRLIDGLNGKYFFEVFQEYKKSYDEKGQETLKENLSLGNKEDKMLEEAEIRFFDLIREHYKNWWS